ncbi:PREDICTED: probable G-protein coupled receptor 171 isoform X1 [Lepidothrix coronata]|uniref:G-protein coupled receptor 171 n=1 Tax=Lepidothrix coronata TaxID=321398 RepID=A0A6J0IY93_9PASS|nr:PREDICTED: probable G-protein coupled receptor 171 isoform X1 [Lepidothrix coronata]
MSSNISECHIYEEMEPFTYFYYLIFLMGIIGSFFALWAFTQKHQKHKPMSIYLINLLTADFLLTLTLPMKIIVDLGIASWNLRIFHCQVTACFIYLNMYLSIIFLGFVSMDRCLQLMHSSKIYRIQEPGFAKTLSVVVWLMILLITVPNMAIPIQHIEERPGAGCIDFKTKFGRDWHVFTNFICTAIFLNFSAVILISNFLVVRQLYRHKYSESYGSVRKALTHILLVTAGYLLCFVPYHAVRIPYTLSQRDATASCPLRRALFKAKESTLLFAVSNLCFDPILYYHLSKSFRLKFTEAFAAPKQTKALTDVELQHSSEQQVHGPSSQTQAQSEPTSSSEQQIHLPSSQTRGQSEPTSSSEQQIHLPSSQTRGQSEPTSSSEQQIHLPSSQTRGQSEPTSSSDSCRVTVHADTAGDNAPDDS